MRLTLILVFVAAFTVRAVDETLPKTRIYPGARPGETGSIGALVMPAPGILRVTRILPGGPAERASMKPDDRILEIDGKKLADLDAVDRVDLLRGKTGTKIALLLSRGEPPQEIRVTMERVALEHFLSPTP